MQNGIEISIDTDTPGLVGVAVEQVSAGAATTLATAQITLPASPAAVGIAVVASAYASDAWLGMFSRDSDGYTIFPTPAAANIAYVGTEAGDYASFKPAQAAVRAAMVKNGGGGAVYFRRGQTYASAAIDDNIQVNGLSPSQPFVVGSTPDIQNARPILQKGFGLGGAEYGYASVQNVVIFGLDFYDPLGDPSVTPTTKGSANPAALNMVNSGAGGKNVWVEDCRVRFFQSGLCFQQAGNLTAPFQTIIVRRCTADHNFGQKYGLYTYYIADLCVEDCLLDNNGWNAAVCPKTVTAHNAYLQEWPSADLSNPQTRALTTLFARASATGIEQRSGGLNDGCCYVGNPIAMNICEHPSTFSNATIMGAGFDLTSGTGNDRGWGAAAVICPTVAFSNVICLDKQDTVNDGWAFQVQCTSTGTAPSVASVATFGGLIVHGWDVWKSSTDLVDGVPVTTVTPPTPTIAYSNCDLPNMPMSTPGIVATPKYLNPNVTIASYAGGIATANVDGAPVVKDAATFLAAAALNRRGAHDSRLTAAAVNAYIREGFVVTG